MHATGIVFTSYLHIRLIGDPNQADPSGRVSKSVIGLWIIAEIKDS